jgi:hypothetical protein
MRLRLGVQELAQSVAGAREHEGQAGDVLVARDSAPRTLAGVAHETEQAQLSVRIGLDRSLRSSTPR